jgi:hypothetical protein
MGTSNEDLHAFLSLKAIGCEIPEWKSQDSYITLWRIPNFDKTRAISKVKGIILDKAPLLLRCTCFS